MPQLPDVQSLGARPTPRSQRGISVYNGGRAEAAMGELGAKIGQIGETMQREDDTAAVFAARRQLDDWERQAIYDPEKGARTKLGQDAFNVPAELAQSYDEFSAKLAEGMTTTRQKQAFAEMSMGRRSQVLNWAAGHAAQQREVYHKAEVTSDLASIQERAARIAATPGDGTPEGAAMQAAQVQAEIQLGQSRLVGYMRERGMPSKEIEGATLDFSSKAHEQIIKTMQQTDPTAAKNYFEAHKKEINANRWDEIGKPLNAMSAALDGDNGAQEIWTALGPKSDLQPVELDKMEAEARKRFANDKPRMDAAISGLRQRREAFNFSERERAAGNTNAVFGMVDSGKRMVDVMRSDAWNALPEKDQRAIRLSFEQEAAMRESRVAAAESRAFTAEQRKDRQALMMNADQYLADSDPTALSQMTREQVAAKRTVYGFEGVQHLLTRWDSLQKPGALGEAKIDQDEFNRIADAAKLHPFDPTKSEKEKRELGTLKAVVEMRIDQQQRELKRPLTRPEKAKLMQEEVDNKVMLDVWGPDKSVSAYQLNADNTDKAYVVIDGKEVKLSSVPSEDRIKIMQARLKAKLPITEADIVRQWVKSRSSTGGVTGRY